MRSSYTRGVSRNEEMKKRGDEVVRLSGPGPYRLFDQRFAREDGAGGEEAGVRGGLAWDGTRPDAVDQSRH